MKKVLSMILVVICILSLCSCGANSGDIFDRYNAKTTSYDIEKDLSSYSIDKSGYNDKVYLVIEDYEYQGVTGKFSVVAEQNSTDSNFYITSLQFYVNYKSSIAPDDFTRLDEYINSKYGEPDGTKGQEAFWNLNDNQTVKYRNNGPVYIRKEFN